LLYSQRFASAPGLEESLVEEPRQISFADELGDELAVIKTIQGNAIQPGWTETAIVLEISNHGPIPIKLTPLIDRLCQLTFFQLKSPLSKAQLYGSRKTDVYQSQKHPLKHKKN